MEDDYSDPRGRRDYHAVKILLIKDYLCEHTDKDHCVTSKDIIQYLEQFGIHADRKTIFADIDRLEYDYGMDIEHNGRKGYRLANPNFEPRELRLMTDSIQSAHFITQKESDAITDKIKKLADVYTRNSLNRKSYVDNRIQRMSESVVTHTDIIHEAISKDLQVSFKYAHYIPSIRKEKRYSNDNKPYIVSPFALYWNNGNYYLYAYVSAKKEFRFFRIDRMESIKLTSIQREGKDAFSSSSLQGSRQVKIFDMYQGEVSNVTLRAENNLTDPIIDAFGKNILLRPENETHFTVNVQVEISPTFFAWLTTFRDKIEIVKPLEIREQMKDFITSVYEQYER